MPASPYSITISDDERSGRPPEITDDAKAWIISVACQKPCELGYAAELWTLAALHKHILRIRCMMFSWFINKLSCSLMIMEIGGKIKQ